MVINAYLYNIDTVTPQMKKVDFYKFISFHDIRLVSGIMCGSLLSNADLYLVYVVPFLERSSVTKLQDEID